MSAALTDHQALDGCFTARAGQTGLPVDMEMMLIASYAACDRVEIPFSRTQTRTSVRYSPFQYLAYGPMKPLNLIIIKGGSLSAGMNSGRPEGLIHVDIAEPGDNVLVQKQGFNQTLAGFQNVGQIAGGKIPFKRFRPETAQDQVGIPYKVKSSKFSGIVKAQFPAVLKA